MTELKQSLGSKIREFFKFPQQKDVPVYRVTDILIPLDINGLSMVDRPMTNHYQVEIQDSSGAWCRIGIYTSFVKAKTAITNHQEAWLGNEIIVTDSVDTIKSYEPSMRKLDADN